MRTPPVAARRRTALTLAMLSVLTALAAAPAVADEIAWSVAPSNNEHGEGRPNYGYELEPGAVIQDGLEVANTGDVELTLVVAAADGFTTANGVLDLVPVTDPQLDLGAWAEPEVSEITLAPGERVEVPFTVTVPSDATPGDHTGGIVTIRTSDAGGTVQLEQRLASRIHVRVPGEQVVALTAGDIQVSQPAQLNPVASGTATVQYSVRNEGSVRTLYTERVTVTGPGGIGSAEAVATVEEILPGSEIVRVVEVPGVWSLGYTDVKVELVPQAVDGELAAPISLDGGAWSVPWALVALLVLVIAAAILIGVLRSRREPSSAATEQVP